AARRARPHQGGRAGRRLGAGPAPGGRLDRPHGVHARHRPAHPHRRLHHRGAAGVRPGARPRARVAGGCRGLRGLRPLLPGGRRLQAAERRCGRHPAPRLAGLGHLRLPDRHRPARPLPAAGRRGRRARRPARGRRRPAPGGEGGPGRAVRAARPAGRRPGLDADLGAVRVVQVPQLGHEVRRRRAARRRHRRAAPAPVRVRSPVAPLVHVVGARPNFVKAAPVVAALAGRDQVLVHTGQHYDERMSDVFFRQLGLPEPDVDLGVGSGSHARQTAALLTALEDELLRLRPRLVVVYGDVNSTLAAALVAAKLHVPVAHVEAGLRSFDDTMPEEINRRVTDTLAELHFVTSPEAIGNLAREGVPTDRVHFVGNPMIDTLLANLDRFDVAAARRAVGLDPEGAYGLVTLHRPANVDDPRAIAALVVALKEVAGTLPLVFPVHPRGRAAFEQAGLTSIAGVTVVDPLGYIEFVSLMRGAALVVTDSGGVQEETTVLRVPC